MRTMRLSKRNDVDRSLTRIVGPRGRRLTLIAGLLAGCVVVAAAVRAYNTAKPIGIAPNPAASAPGIQAGGKARSDFHRGLAFQPEVDRFRRRLGVRFTKPGRERAVLTGTLTLGAQQFQTRIIRNQEDSGEQVDITLNGGSALTWNAEDGAKSGGSSASGAERSLIERIALDSPDQFVLAQIRGASYYTIARSVQPAGVGDDYSGPVWDLIRVVEPQHGSSKKPLNEWRIYYINCETGLIDKMLYQDQGQEIVVELFGWANRTGELEPSAIRWIRDGKLEMELSLNGFSHGSK